MLLFTASRPPKQAPRFSVSISSVVLTKGGTLSHLGTGNGKGTVNPVMIANLPRLKKTLKADGLTNEQIHRLLVAWSREASRAPLVDLLP